MSDKKTLFLVPEYYKNFQCKCGDCRHPCCEGWPVRISMKEYHRLLGMECSKKLRSKLDCALKVCTEPSEECYAQIINNWQGTCMLHREDGLCTIQAELGENALPEICRLYPRNIKKHPDKSECSCSNSCEETIELLLNIKEPMRFEEINLSLEPSTFDERSADDNKCSKKSILIMQDRCMQIPERFIALENYLCGTEFTAKRPANYVLAFQTMHVFATYFESSSSVHDYCEAAEKYFKIEKKEKLSGDDLKSIKEKFNSSCEHFQNVFPDWQVFFEQLIVNTMFYNSFPYKEKQSKKYDSFLSLAAIYAFLRFNMLVYMSDKTETSGIVDFASAMFRLIEHSDFRNISLRLLQKEQDITQDCISQLLYL